MAQQVILVCTLHECEETMTRIYQASQSAIIVLSAENS